MSSDSRESSSTHVLNPNNNYRGHSLTDILLTCQEFFGTNFQQIQGKNIQFTETQFQECSFDVATVRNSSWKKCLLSQCSGKFVDFENTRFTACTLEKSSFLQASFYECSFEDSSISQVNFQGSDLRSCSFKNASLDSVNLRNCDLAGADLSGVSLVNCIVQGARISNVIGLDPELKDHLLANGAYQGFTPTVNKLKTHGQILNKRLSELRQKAENLPLPSLRPQRLLNWSQETYQEWKTAQQKQRERRVQEERLWKEEQEKRRQSKSEQRKERESRRKQEQERLQNEKKELQKRKRFRKNRLRQLQKQETQQQRREQSLQEFLLENPRSEMPPELLQAANTALQAFERADQTAAIEAQRREDVYQAPEDETLFEKLTEAITESQQSAEEAIAKQKIYQELLKDWQSQQESNQEFFLQLQLQKSEQHIHLFQKTAEQQQKQVEARQREHEEARRGLERALLQQAEATSADLSFLHTQQKQEKERREEEIEQALRLEKERIAAEIRRKTEEIALKQALEHEQTPSEEPLAAPEEDNELTRSEEKQRVYEEVEEKEALRKKIEQAENSAREIAQQLREEQDEQRRAEQDAQRADKERWLEEQRARLAEIAQEQKSNAKREEEEQRQKEEQKQKKAKEQKEREEQKQQREIIRKQEQEERRQRKEEAERRKQEKILSRKQEEDRRQEEERRKEEQEKRRRTLQQKILRAEQEQQKRKEKLQQIHRADNTAKEIADAIRKEQEERAREEEKQRRQEERHQKRLELEKQRQQLEAEKREKQRALAAQQQIEKEKRAALQQEERLQLLKRQLLDEAYRQEYEEMEEQLSLEYNEKSAQEEQLEKKKQQLQEQLKQEEERLKNDPLLQEAKLQELLFERQKKRLLRLEQKEQDIKEKLRSLEQEEALDRLEASQKSNIHFAEIIEQVQLNPQSSWQRYWYRFTDVIARQSPSFANQLDQFKELVEEEIIARRALAVRAREQQKQIAKEALEEKRQQEQQQRIARLEFIRAKEEEREKRRVQEERSKAQQRSAQERRRQLLEMSSNDRHDLRRNESQTRDIPKIEHAEADLRSANLQALDWHGANLQHALLSAAKMDSIGLIKANCAHASLDFARLYGATMDGCNLEKANLEGAGLKEASLVGAWLRLARLYDCDLQQVDFTGAHLPKVDFTGSIAQKASFAGADVSDAIFSEVRLEGASFRGARLVGAIFDRAHLSEVDFHQAEVQSADFRGVFGLSKEELLQLQSQGALVHLEDAQDYAAGPVTQIRAAIVLFVLGLGSFLFSSYLSSVPSELGSLEKEAEELRLEDPLLASQKYEALASQTQTLEDQVNYLIEAAVLSEQANDIDRAQTVFQKALVAADFHTELHTKLNLRLAQFYLEHAQPQQAKQALDSLLSTQTLSSFQRARLIIYNEMIAEILELDLGTQLQPIYQQLEGLPEVEADLRMALSDLRLQRQQPQRALAELEIAAQLPISDELHVRLLEATARVHDRIGNLSESVSAYETLLGKIEPDSLTAKAARLALADLMRRQEQPALALGYLEELIATENDARLLSRALFIQGRIYEEQEQISLATERYQQVLNVETAEPETKEEARISLARLVLQGKTENTDSLSPEIMAQASLGKMRSLLDKSAPEQVLEMSNELLSTDTLGSDIHRAAKNIRAEALSAMGKYQEANDEWEELLRSAQISSIEKQHIENLLAYNRLQNNDIEGARTAFLSLRNSSDLSTRSQGMLGLAETYRLTGELEKAKDLYLSILEQNQDREILLQTWQELSEIASEQDRPEDRLQAWQNILLNAGEDQSLQEEAHRSIASALVELERFDEAIAECELGMNTPAAELQCASILEILGDVESLSRYQRLAENTNLPTNLRAEAALGAARQLQEEPQFELLRQTLELSPIEPVIELQLLYFMENHRSKLSAQEQDKLEEREKILSELAPDLLIQQLLEQMSRYRAQGMLDKAIQQMKRGISNLSPEKSLPLRLELADMYLENQNPQEAETEYSAIISEDTELRFPAQFGLALSFAAQEKYSEMLSLLQEIKPENAEQLEGIQQLLESIPEQAKSEDVSALWKKLAQQSNRADLQFAALLQEADQLLQNDQFDDAMEKYEAAENIALEEQQTGWAKLGKARTLSTAEKDPSTILLSLLDHPNLEIQMQSTIQLAQFYLEQNKPTETLALLAEKSAYSLGPGWDSSLEEIRIYALSAVDQYDEANQTISELSSRWPNEEQVQIPAKILSIQLLKQQEQYDDAQDLLQQTLQETSEEGYTEMLRALGEELARY